MGITDFDTIFREKIVPALAPVEDLRSRTRSAYLFAGFSLVLLIASILLVSHGGNELLVVVLLAAIGVVIYSWVKAYEWQKKYRALFKELVVSELVRAVHPEWNYAPDRMIAPEVYVRSDLFRSRYDRYSGDDLVWGVMEKTDFACSELHTERLEVTHNSKGQRQERWVTIFRGLFFHADFNKEFQGRTYVSPDFAQRFLGRLGQTFQKISGPAALVKLENPDFEQEFVVHATDQVEARYILTPAIMEAMLRIRQRCGCKVHFSFIGTRVYCAISFGKSLFEPKVFGRVLQQEEAANMFDLFQLNGQIIEDLNLNTRIWTKQ